MNPCVPPRDRGSGRGQVPLSIACDGGICLGMGASTPSKGLRWIAAGGVVALVALLLVSRGQRSTGEEPGGQAKAAPAEAHRAEAPEPGPASPPPRMAENAGDAAPEPGPAGVTQDGEYPVDLERLRARLPDNLYWKLGAPTEDPEVLQMRAEEEQRWNELFGKVQSNTATEEEIRRYYDHRRKLSEDYLEFAALVLQEHGARLSERDRGLYELSVKLHSSRLDEIQRQVDDALARRREHEQRRETWRNGDGAP